jgi:hypothetical protein
MVARMNRRTFLRSAGVRSIPPVSRIAVPDSSLDLIVAYLTRPAADRAPSPDSRAPSQPAAAPGDAHAKPTGGAHEWRCA